MSFLPISVQPEVLRRLMSDEVNLKVSALNRTIHLSERSSFEAPCLVNAVIDDYSRVKVGAFSSVAVARIGNVEMGRYCAIGDEVRIGANEHPIDRITVSRIPHVPTMHNWHKQLPPEHAAKVAQKPFHFTEACPITEIGNDVWIGYGAYIRAGVKIGDGAVIGARSVVTKDVPPYAIVVGTPAKVIRMRFPEPIIDELMALKWWQYSIYDMFDMKLDNIEALIPQIKEAVAAKKLVPYQGKIYTAKDLAANTIHLAA